MAELSNSRIRIGVIGAGFAGLSAAACLAQEGFDVTVFEKNSTPGGRARKFDEAGYRFDMGPSWYWMPDVFEKYFNRFGNTTADYYDLKRLDPSYRVFFSELDSMDLPAGVEAIAQLFERVEPGSARLLKQFLQEGKYKYEVGMQEIVYKPGLSIFEFLDWKFMKGVLRLNVFNSVSKVVRNSFKDPRLIQLLEFPVLFLGADAAHTPALYTLMNYADMALGTWYPQGGMYKIVEAMAAVATNAGVKMEFDSAVEEVVIEGNQVTGLRVNQTFRPLDGIVAGADYHHVEQHLLAKPYRRYTEAYWEKRKLAPSCLIFYLGVNKKLDRLLHHNLFFDRDFALHAREIYETPAWPTDPLFYVSVPSKTDPSVAPVGHENVFILIPVASGLVDDPGIREKYFELVIRRMEHITGESFRANIEFRKSYATSDFISDYNAFKGNAYGLANTIRQTANLKPSILNKKVSNLFYTGQLTVPGPGVPPALISGQLVAREVAKRLKKINPAIS